MPIAVSSFPEAKNAGVSLFFHAGVTGGVVTEIV
jgi:hypothetical protein